MSVRFKKHRDQKTAEVLRRSRRRRRLFAETLEDRRLLAVYTPNTFDDPTVNDDEVFSLREAIIAANATPTLDVINLSTDGTYALSLFDGEGAPDQEFGDLDITSPILLRGIGGQAHINASGNDDRVLEVHGGALAVLSSVRLSGGTAIEGGGVSNWGNFYAFNSSIDSNVAEDGGGLYNASGALARLVGSSVSLNGSEIIDDDVSNLLPVTMSSERGGGIYNAEGGTLQLSNSDVEDNFASFDGGGIYNQGDATLEG